MEPKKPFLRRTFSALSYRDFRNLIIGNGISNVGSWMQLVAQPWLVLTLSQSPFLVGLDGFMGHLPSFLFLIPGGTLADRHSRKQIMILSQIAQLLSAALIALLLVIGKVQVWEIIALSFAVGTAQAFSFPAYQALVTTLIPREHLGNAIALNSMQFNLTRIIGPLLAGAAMAGIGAAWCFGLNSLSFFALLIALWSLSSPAAEANPAGAETREREPILAGFRMILGNRRIFGALLLVASSTMFAGPITTFLPVLVRNVFGGDASSFSVSAAIFGAGALLGAFLTAANSTRLGVGLTAASCTGLGVLVLLMALAPALWVADLILFWAGMLTVMSTSSANTFLQSNMGNAFRARTASLFLLSIRGGLALGNLATGWAAGSIGVRTALAADGTIALLCVGAIWWRFLRFAPILNDDTRPKPGVGRI